MDRLDCSEFEKATYDDDFMSIMYGTSGSKDPRVKKVSKQLYWYVVIVWLFAKSFSWQELLSAGTGTSACTVEWALLHLLQNPSAMKKTQEELSSVVGKNSEVGEGDIPKLEYLQAVVKETFRLGSPGGLIMTTQACSIAGFHIPKGATLFVNTFAIGRDPDVWDNPALFYPERFLGKEIDVRAQHFELLPFGSGRRTCPGMPLGLWMVQLLLANLVHGFCWTFVPGRDKRDYALETQDGIVNWLKSPLELMASPKVVRRIVKTVLFVLK